MRDFYPEQQRIQDYIFKVWSKTCESFGYEKYNAPTLEPTELYAGKTSDEIVNDQTYTFTDRGERSVTLRTEMTPSVTRMVAARVQELSYPLRWYSIPNCFRYERPQKGRLREFWQLNVDMFGVAMIDAELEMIKLSDAIMKAFGASDDMYQIKINSRRLTNLLMSDWLELDSDQSMALIRLLDKKDKMSEEDFLDQATQVTGEAKTDKIKQLLEAKTLADLPEMIKDSDSVKEIQTLFTLLESHDLAKNVVFDISLMRGFDYYTDIVFEVFDTDPENNRSLFGGGRYDDLMSIFGAKSIPSIGFGIGDAMTLEFLQSHKLLPALTPATQVYTVTLGEVLKDAQELADSLRKDGINVAVDNTGRKADKQIKTAIKDNIPYLLFVGEKEVKAKKYILRDTKTQNEQTLDLNEIVKFLAKWVN
jgi:histidyl-tRNA synthetase